MSVTTTGGTTPYVRLGLPSGYPFTTSEPFYIDEPDIIDALAAAEPGYTEILLETGAYTTVGFPGTITPAYVDIPIASYY